MDMSSQPRGVDSRRSGPPAKKTFGKPGDTTLKRDQDGVKKTVGGAKRQQAGKPWQTFANEATGRGSLKKNRGARGGKRRVSEAQKERNRDAMVKRCTLSASAPIAVQDLAVALDLGGGAVVKFLMMDLGVMARCPCPWTRPRPRPSPTGWGTRC